MVGEKSLICVSPSNTSPQPAAVSVTCSMPGEAAASIGRDGTTSSVLERLRVHAGVSNA